MHGMYSWNEVLTLLSKKVSVMAVEKSFLMHKNTFVHLLSRCYAPAAYHCQSTTAISRTVDAHAPVVIQGCRHKLTQAQICKLYENFTYSPHAAHAALR